MTIDPTARKGRYTEEAQRLNRARPKAGITYIFVKITAWGVFLSLIAAVVWVSGLLAR